MFKKLAQVFTGDPFKKKLEEYSKIVEQINHLETGYETLSQEALHAKTAEFKTRLAKGEALDGILPEAFAAVREASKRVLGQRHYDVQMICAINLHRGGISEMRTGEGKTLAATLPLYLNSLEGKGVHLVTVNDYLARRDGRWMGAIFNLLGLSVGILQMASLTENGQLAYIFDPNENSLFEEKNQLRPVQRRQAYLADITYGTNSEFGFDYLRDNITMSLEQRVQRGHHYAIIDEVDNILIDEARTPLIISGPAQDDSENYRRMTLVVKALVPEDYEVLEKDRTVSLTEIGLVHVEELLGTPLRDPDRPEDITPEQARMLGYLEQALRAQFLFRRNKDYIVQADNVIIVDEFTGRLMPGRRWSDGLHQAVEAKEGVKVQAENITHATITIQNYFRMYKKLAGMTGTALTEAEEFYRIYKLDVLPIPTNLEYIASMPETDLKAVDSKDENGYKVTFYANPGDTVQKPLYWKRQDYPDVIFRSEEGKLRAIVREIIQFHVTGRPQLVGTTSVENSERLSERLSTESVRTLLQTLLIRHAWYLKHNTKEGETVSIPELNELNTPLNQLRSNDLRKLASSLGLNSINLSDPQNLQSLLEILDLSENDMPRLLPILDAGIPHKVLNARKHTEESLIIAGAGAFGAVTIATNMAGRGVDIKLGGELPEKTLSQVNRILSDAGVPDPYNMRMEERFTALKSIAAENYALNTEDVENFFKYMEDMARVRELGGLHIVGSERHEARRIDNQLRGRAARQGDPGSSRFYLSLEDDLMRLFGGAQVEMVMSRLKFDETLPIESGLVGKMVESSQTRVEGANFDVRKHLLEYDDVLNEQRQRIYTQRDRIFTKPDLREDVTEMLRTELGNRIDSALNDPEGPWKLLAYLDEIQPPLNFTWLTFPSYSQKLLIDHIGQTQDEDELKNRLLEIAGESVGAENEHLLANVDSLLERSTDSLKSQLDERYDALDTFIEGMQDGEPGEKRDLGNELAAILHLPIRLTASQLKTLNEDPLELKKPLRDTVRQALTQVLVNRLVLTFERRLGESWSLNASELAAMPIKEIHKTIRQQVETSLARRTERLLGENGEVKRDLEANYDHLSAALTDQGELMRLLMLLTQGTVIAFDARSHKRILKQATRMSYVFMIATWLEGKTSQQITADVLQHLEQAEQEFVQVFGNAEWEHVVNNVVPLKNMAPANRNFLKELLGGQAYDSLQEQTLSALDERLKPDVVTFLGKQMQNSIYRRLLLGTISEAWVEYLTRMEALRVSIGMEAYAQRDPLVEYKGKASMMFKELLSEVRAGVISKMFRYRPAQAAESQTTLRNAQASTPSGDKSDAVKSAGQPGKKKRKRH